MRLSIMLVAALSLAGCTAAQVAAPTTPPPVAAPDRGDAILAVAGTAAAVADAIGQAPPATLSRTTIDERGIRAAFVTFEGMLDVIDAFVASGDIVRNSPTALTIKRGVLATQSALNAASAAQRAGSAVTYTAALRNAEKALAEVRSALAR